MAEKKENNSNKYGPGSLFIPGGVILGMGVGFLIDNLVGGLFVGLGLGFITFAISAFYYQKRK
jgi:hypothetical protein